MDNINTNIDFDDHSEETMVNEINIDNLDKEASMQMMRKLMSNDNDVDGTFKDLFNIMTDTFDNYESIDKDMVAKLTGIFQNSLEKKDVFDMAKAIDEGSTIVYFKSAQLFKIYKKEELMSLLDGQLRTIFKHINQSFEVVPNNSEQKIIIMGDITLVDQIEHIKKYISQFMVNKGVQDFKDDDIICFKNDSTNMIEIVINNYYVNNSSERNEIVQDLLKYILMMEKNTNMTRKLGYMPDCSGFDNADVVSMPSEKQLINEDKCFVEMIDRLIRNTSKCSKLVKEGNTYIINLYNNSTITNIANVENLAINSNYPENVEDFLTHIREDRPEWYKECEWIKKDIIYEEYNELYDFITKKAFAVMFKDKIYKHEKRQTVNKKRSLYVELFSISDL